MLDIRVFLWYFLCSTVVWAEGPGGAPCGAPLLREGFLQ